MPAADAQFKVAVVQAAPVVLERAATSELAVAKVDEAADEGARLVAFSEAFVPGYPDWIWRLRPDNFAMTSELWSRFVPQTVDLDADDLAPLRDAARRRDVTIALGVSERDGTFSRATIYNTFVVIGPSGDILLRHRKLVPTGAERMVWGAGDGVGLEAVETPVGRVGGLICWENYMPLARFALFASGVQVYIAPTWDMGDRWVASMRHIAVEGRCWFLACGSVMRAADIPASLPGRGELYPNADEWVNAGDSAIISPNGDVVAGPLHEEEGILYAHANPAVSDQAHRLLDVAGHYGRPDVFHLTVDRSPRQPVEPPRAGP